MLMSLPTKGVGWHLYHRLSIEVTASFVEGASEPCFAKKVGATPFHDPCEAIYHIVFSKREKQESFLRRFLALILRLLVPRAPLRLYSPQILVMKSYLGAKYYMHTVLLRITPRSSWKGGGLHSK